ncbi:Uncharacterized protein OBRU01_20091, partial [Operophtera brumata]
MPKKLHRTFQAGCRPNPNGVARRAVRVVCRIVVVHASQACSGLTGKQLSALRNADTLDWTCHECRINSPKLKSSFITPDEDDEEDEEEVLVNSK